MFFFSVWIFLSFMFLMNLGVGVIVDKFMDERQEQNTDELLPAQKQWNSLRMVLHKAGYIFVMEHLDQLPPWRRKVYDLVNHKIFDAVIMTCIVVNTMLMAVESY